MTRQSLTQILDRLAEIAARRQPDPSWIAEARRSFAPLEQIGLTFEATLDEIRTFGRAAVEDDLADLFTL